MLHVIYLCIYVSVYLSIYQSIHLSTYMYLYLSWIIVSFRLHSISLSLSIHVSWIIVSSTAFYLSIHLSWIIVSTSFLSISISIHLSKPKWWLVELKVMQNWSSFGAEKNCTQKRSHQGADTRIKFRWGAFHLESPENGPKIIITFKNLQKQLWKRPTCAPPVPAPGRHGRLSTKNQGRDKAQTKSNQRIDGHVTLVRYCHVGLRFKSFFLSKLNTNFRKWIYYMLDFS